MNNGKRGDKPRPVTAAGAARPLPPTQDAGDAASAILGGGKGVKTASPKVFGRFLEVRVVELRETESRDVVMVVHSTVELVGARCDIKDGPVPTILEMECVVHAAKVAYASQIWARRVGQ